MVKPNNRIKPIVVIVAAIIVAGLILVHMYAGDSNLDAPIIEAVHKGKNIRIEWQGIPSAEEYEVFKAKLADEKPKLIATTEETSYLDKKTVAGQTVYYSVRAKNKISRSEFSNEVKDTLFKVYVETGHGIDENGKWDTGCTWGGDEEAKLMIPIARATAFYLKKNGICVYTDAYKENNSNLNEALDFLNNSDVNVFVNIHCDYENAESGTMPLYNNKEQKKLARMLNNGVHKYVDINDRGIAWRNDLETLCNKKVHCTSCLYETGCISKDNIVLRYKYDEYGKGLASGICEYLGINFED